MSNGNIADGPPSLSVQICGVPLKVGTSLDRLGSRAELDARPGAAARTASRSMARSGVRAGNRRHPVAPGAETIRTSSVSLQVAGAPSCQSSRRVSPSYRRIKVNGWNRCGVWTVVLLTASSSDRDLSSPIHPRDGCRSTWPDAYRSGPSRCAVHRPRTTRPRCSGHRSCSGR